MSNIDFLYEQSVECLKKLIAIPSLSREEDATATFLAAFLQKNDIKTERLMNNVWAKNLHFDENKPTILLNSHHDTVKPNPQWTFNPFEPVVQDGKLYGLGSNDAGASLVSLMATFIYFYTQQDLAYNLIFAATAEEEISGKNGIEALLPQLGKIDFAIVGEPTEMNLAISERGLMVLDCEAQGKAGHAARNEGINAIYKAIEDIYWFQYYQFPTKETTNPVKMSVTIIQAGSQHNVVPDSCRFTVDVRTGGGYSNEEVLEIIKKNVRCHVTPRSLRLNSSYIPETHPFVQIALEIGKQTFHSPTLSDQALMPFTSVKIGPGFSGRSHTADEFIYLSEIENGINDYITILKKMLTVQT
jgi:acetylornithine deacetylase